jgi:hypothetical protein
MPVSVVADGNYSADDLAWLASFRTCAVLAWLSASCYDGHSIRYLLCILILMTWWSCVVIHYSDFVMMYSFNFNSINTFIDDLMIVMCRWYTITWRWPDISDIHSMIHCLWWWLHFVPGILNLMVMLFWCRVLSGYPTCLEGMSFGMPILMSFCYKWKYFSAMSVTFDCGTVIFWYVLTLSWRVHSVFDTIVHFIAWWWDS